MIGSLMSRLGAAEKLSIPQLQKAIQDGTLPAYVGIPLLQQKVQESKQAQMAMAGAAAPQPSIAQQVMGEAQGIEAAKSNLPSDGFAPGGIVGYGANDADDGYAGGGMVAFAGGDLIDEELDDSTEDEFDKMLTAAQTENADLLSRYQGEGIADINLTPQAAKEFGITQQAPTGTGIRPEARAPRGIEALEQHVIAKESGGKDFDKHGNPLTSKAGAKYAMQVMPATAKDPGFGIAPAKNDSAAEYNRVGRELLAKLYQKYGDEKLAAAAYNWGTGNVDKWLASGKGIDALPGETQKYIAGLAQGGAVKKYAGETNGSLVQGDDLTPDQIAELKKPYIGYRRPRIVPQPDQRPPLTGISGILSDKYAIDKPVFVDPTSPAGGAVEYQPGTDDTYIPELNEASRATPAVYEKLKEEEEKVVKAAKGKEEPETAATKMQAYLDKLTADLQKQREQDKYLSLLAAGLGMMGGTSPHGMTNIGQGAMKGIEAQLAANKLAGAQELGITKGQLGAYTLAQNQDMRRAIQLDNQKKDAYGKMGVIRNNIEKNVLAGMKLDIESLGDPQVRAKVDKEVERRLASSPEYRGLHKIATGLDYDYGMAGNSTPAGPVNYQGLYGLTPRKG